MILKLKSSFSSAHLYHQPQWSTEKNQEVFGRCFTEHGHGHNYTLQVSFKTSEETLPDDQERYQGVLKAITKVLDHEHLNFVVPEFKDAIPTTENIATYCLEKIKKTIPASQIYSLRLYEMDNLWTEIKL